MSKKIECKDFGDTIKELYKEYKETEEIIKYYQPKEIKTKNGEVYTRVYIDGDLFYDCDNFEHPLYCATIARLVHDSEQIKKLRKEYKKKVISHEITETNK